MCNLPEWPFTPEEKELLTEEEMEDLLWDEADKKRKQLIED